MDARKLIGALQDTLDIYKKKMPVPRPAEERQDVNYLIALEAQYAYKQFERMLEKMRRIEGNDVTDSHVNLLKEYLAEREQMIMKTPADYFSTPKSDANEFCLEVAGVVGRFAKHAGISCPKSRPMVMPSIESWVGGVTQRHLDEGIPLHGLQRTDNGRNLIEVGKVVQRYYMGHRREFKTSHLPLGEERELSVTEIYRITNHSALAKKLLDKKNPDYSERDAFSTAIESDDYMVTAKFANGYTDLKASLLELKTDLFTDREQLFEYMAHKVTRDDWNKFLNIMAGHDGNNLENAKQSGELSDAEKEFLKLVNPEGGISSAVVNSGIYNGNLRHDVAVLFCLAKAHLINRVLHGNHTGWLGFLGGYDKDTKLDALDILMEYLISTKDVEHLKPWEDYLQNDLSIVVEKKIGKKLNQQVDKEVAEGKVPEEARAIRKSELVMASVSNIKGALQQGTLGYITQQFNIIQRKAEEVKFQAANELEAIKAVSK